MSDANILINPGTVTKVDTRTVGGGTDEHRQVMVIGDPVTAAAVAHVEASDTDEQVAADYGITMLDRNYLFNGTTWDRERNDVEVTLLTSAGRAVTTPGPDTVAHNHESLLLRISVTSIGTGSITPELQDKELTSGAYYPFWRAELPIIANGTFEYYFANGGSGGDWTECQAFGLGSRTFRANIVANNANSVTYSVSAVLGDT